MVTKTPNTTTANTLRKPQIRIMECLKKANKPLTRKEIVDKTELDPSWMGTWIGLNDTEKRVASDKQYNLKSLLTLKYVKFAMPEEGGPAAYELTAAGRKALEKAQSKG